MAYCHQCGAEIGDTKFCSNCGAEVPKVGESSEGTSPEAPPQGSGSATGSSDQNVIAAVSYLVITAIIFLLIEPYKRNRFVRFHCFQAIFFWLGSLVIWAAVGIAGSMFGFLVFSLTPLVGLGLLVTWVIVLVKALQGEMFKLPIIGDLAEKQI